MLFIYKCLQSRYAKRHGLRHPMRVQRRSARRHSSRMGRRALRWSKAARRNPADASRKSVTTSRPMPHTPTPFPAKITPGATNKPVAAQPQPKENRSLRFGANLSLRTRLREEGRRSDLCRSTYDFGSEQGVRLTGAWGLASRRLLRSPEAPSQRRVEEHFGGQMQYFLKILRTKGSHGN